MLTIVIEGKKEVFAKIKNFAGLVEDAVQDQIVLAMDEIYNRSLMAAPTTVEKDINIRATAYKDFGKLNGEVGYKTVMAAYYEFGTGAFIDIPSGLEDYAMTFFINGKGRIEPQAFLFPAFFSVGREFGDEVLKSINEIWNS